MKFRKKATVCELVLFIAPPPDRPVSGDTPVFRRPDGTFAVFNELHKSEITLESGDYVNVTTEGDYYPIKAHIVAESYEPVEGV